VLSNGAVIEKRLSIRSAPMSGVRYIRHGDNFMDARFKNVSAEVLSMVGLKNAYIQMTDLQNININGHSYELALHMIGREPGTYSGVLENHISTDDTTYFSDPGLVSAKASAVPDLKIPSMMYT
jgi:hypothetical protein